MERLVAVSRGSAKKETLLKLRECISRGKRGPSGHSGECEVRSVQ